MTVAIPAAWVAAFWAMVAGFVFTVDLLILGGFLAVLALTGLGVWWPDPQMRELDDDFWPCRIDHWLDDERID